jgi:hypothetical protein
LILITGAAAEPTTPPPIDPEQHPRLNIITLEDRSVRPRAR